MISLSRCFSFPLNTYTHGAISPFPATSDCLLSPLMMQAISLLLFCWKIPTDSGNFPWYMTKEVAVLKDSYSKAVVCNLLCLLYLCSYVNMKFGSASNLCTKYLRSHLVECVVETNWIFEYKPLPALGSELCWKGGILASRYGICMYVCMYVCIKQFWMQHILAAITAPWGAHMLCLKHVCSLYVFNVWNPSSSIPIYT